MEIKKRPGEEGWVLMDTLTALLLSAALMGALGTLLVRTAETALHLRQGAEKLIELRNTTGAPPGEADEPR